MISYTPSPGDLVMTPFGICEFLLRDEAGWYVVTGEQGTRYLPAADIRVLSRNAHDRLVPTRVWVVLALSILMNIVFLARMVYYVGY